MVRKLAKKELRLNYARTRFDFLLEIKTRDPVWDRGYCNPYEQKRTKRKIKDLRLELKRQKRNLELLKKEQEQLNLYHFMWKWFVPWYEENLTEYEMKLMK